MRVVVMGVLAMVMLAVCAQVIICCILNLEIFIVEYMMAHSKLIKSIMIQDHS